jgi:UDP-N-acetylglucosamine acyltransferase
MAALIHPTAIIDPDAVLAPGVSVGPGAVIEGNTVIGEGCRIDAYASVKAWTRMGRHNHIHSYALVGGEPQDLKFDGEVTWLEIGDGNTIREFATLHRGTGSGGGLTRIGDNNLLMAYTHVAHDCVLGNNVIMSNAATLAGHVVVEDNAIISGLSAAHQFVRIGRHSFVGGMTGIGQDMPPFMLATENRGLLRGPNLVGLRRSGFSSCAINALRAAFKLIWLSGVPRREALETLEQEYKAVPEIHELVQFVRSSSRGVLQAFRETADDAG